MALQLHMGLKHLVEVQTPMWSVVVMVSLDVGRLGWGLFFFFENLVTEAVADGQHMPSLRNMGIASDGKKETDTPNQSFRLHKTHHAACRVFCSEI